jgi:hypothetical protein
MESYTAATKTRAKQKKNARLKKMKKNRYVPRETLVFFLFKLKCFTWNT